MKASKSMSVTELAGACRVCLRPGAALGGRALASRSRGRAAAAAVGTPTLLDMLYYCFSDTLPVPQDERYPQSVCRSCVRLINTSYKFKKTYKRTVKQLRTILGHTAEFNATALITMDSALKEEVGNERRDEMVVKSTVIKDDDEINVNEAMKDLRGEAMQCEKNIIKCDETRSKSEDGSERGLSELDDAPLSEFVEDLKIKDTKEKKPETIGKKAAGVSRERTQRCGECGYTTKERAAWREHLKLHPYTRFLCTCCAKGFKNMFTLNVHMRRHTRDKPFVCATCGRRFTQKHSLAVHERALHRKERPYACHLCHDRFPRKEALLIHVRARHTRERPYACAACGARFNQPANLATHLATHTRDKRYACSQCQFRSAYSNALRKHERAHRGERNHKCGACGKAFADNSSLSRHRRIHTGELPYRCASCPRAFIDSWKRSQHVARAHPAPSPAPAAGAPTSDVTTALSMDFTSTPLELISIK